LFSKQSFKKIKKKEMNASKIYSPVANVPSGYIKLSEKTLKMLGRDADTRYN